MFFQYIVGTDPNLGKYTKTFWYSSGYRGTWIEAEAICDSYDLTLATLDSQQEADFLLPLYSANNLLFDAYTHIGAVATVPFTKTDYFWLQTGAKVNFTMRFLPGFPDNYGGKEVCLSLTYNGGVVYFNDIQCFEAWSLRFICQSISYDSITTVPPPTRPVTSPTVTPTTGSWIYFFFF